MNARLTSTNCFPVEKEKPLKSSKDEKQREFKKHTSLRLCRLCLGVELDPKTKSNVAFFGILPLVRVSRVGTSWVKQINGVGVFEMKIKVFTVF